MSKLVLRLFFLLLALVLACLRFGAESNISSDSLSIVFLFSYTPQCLQLDKLLVSLALPWKLRQWFFIFCLNWGKKEMVGWTRKCVCKMLCRKSYSWSEKGTVYLWKSFRSYYVNLLIISNQLTKNDIPNSDVFQDALLTSLQYEQTFM